MSQNSTVNIHPQNLLHYLDHTSTFYYKSVAILSELFCCLLISQSSIIKIIINKLLKNKKTFEKGTHLKKPIHLKIIDIAKSQSNISVYKFLIGDKIQYKLSVTDKEISEFINKDASELCNRSPIDILLDSNLILDKNHIKECIRYEYFFHSKNLFLSTPLHRLCNNLSTNSFYRKESLEVILYLIEEIFSSEDEKRYLFLIGSNSSGNSPFDALIKYLSHTERLKVFDLINEKMPIFKSVLIDGCFWDNESKNKIKNMKVSDIFVSIL